MLLLLSLSLLLVGPVLSHHHHQEDWHHLHDACACIGITMRHDSADCLYAILSGVVQDLPPHVHELRENLQLASDVLRDMLDEYPTDSNESPTDSTWEYISPFLGNITCGEDYIQGLLVIERITETGHEIGTVCDDVFDYNDVGANLICRYLGFDHGEILDMDGSSSGLDIEVDDLHCDEYVSELNECQRLPWGEHNCVHQEDVGLRCYHVSQTHVDFYDILRETNVCLDYHASESYTVDVWGHNDGNYAMGRVEVYSLINEESGTVCDDGWTDVEAGVVCNMLGYEHGVARYLYDPHPVYIPGGEDIPIVLDQVSCLGDEENLADCTAQPWREHDCQHSEDAGVYCWTFDEFDPSHLPEPTAPEYDTHLGNITCSEEGYVDALLLVSYEGMMGTVCDDGFYENEVNVVCQSLGFEWGEVLDMDGTGTGLDILLDDVYCEGTEGEMNQCESSPWGHHNCGHYEDVGVRCHNFLHAHFGFYDILRSEVVCIPDDEPVDPIEEYRNRFAVLRDFYCNENYVDGLLVVRNEDGEYGTVCNRNFAVRNFQGPDVVCRSLGFVSGELIERNGYLTGLPIGLDNVKCEGEEGDLSECTVRRWGRVDRSCDHSTDVGVRCYTDGPVTETMPFTYDVFNEREACTADEDFVPPEPVDMPEPEPEPITDPYMPSLLEPVCSDGYVEALLAITSTEGQGLVCGDRFKNDNIGADLACRVLGFTGGEVIDRDGSNSGLDIVLDNVRCLGDEVDLSQCSHRRWGRHDCDHSNDSGVRCFVDVTIEASVVAYNQVC